MLIERHTQAHWNKKQCNNNKTSSKLFGTREAEPRRTQWIKAENVSTGKRGLDIHGPWTHPFVGATEYNSLHIISSCNEYLGAVQFLALGHGSHFSLNEYLWGTSLGKWYWEREISKGIYQKIKV